MPRTTTGGRNRAERGKRRVKDLAARKDRTVKGGAPKPRRLDTVTFTATVSP
jgi:hypothetical protein